MTAILIGGFYAAIDPSMVFMIVSGSASMALDGYFPGWEWIICLPALWLVAQWFIDACKGFPNLRKREEGNKEIPWLRNHLIPSRAIKNMCIGACLAGVGGLITLVTYEAAANGGGYVVAWGAMAVGGIQFALGVLEWLFTLILKAATASKSAKN